VEAPAERVLYVTSPSTMHTLPWWALFLVAVGLLGTVAAVVLPVYYFCRNRSRRAEESARGAKMNKSIQEMTARLYRTRQQQLQQYEYGIDPYAAQLFGVVQANPDARQGAQREKRKSPPPPLQEEAIQTATSPLCGGTGGGTSVRHRNLSWVVPTAAQLSNSRAVGCGEDAAVAGIHGSVLPRRSRVVLQRSDAAQFERRASDQSTISSNASASVMHRYTSVGSVAARAPPSRSLVPSPSPGQLTSAPSVRAFAGISRVGALRRALGGPQLLPVAPVCASVHSTSNSFAGMRQPSTSFVASGAFDGSGDESGSDGQANDSIFRGTSSGSTSGDLLGGAFDTMQLSSSATVAAGWAAACWAAAGFADFRFPLLPPPPQPLKNSFETTAASLYADVLSESSFLQATTAKGAAQDCATNAKVHPVNEASHSGIRETRAAATAVRQPSMDRISAEMQRLLKPDAAVNGVMELGDTAAPCIPAVMEDNLHGPFSASFVVPTMEASEDEEDEGEDTVASSSKSSRFVLVRNGTASGMHRVEGRLITVDTVRSMAGESGEEEEATAAVTPAIHQARESEEEGGQCLLSQGYELRVEGGCAAPSSSPTRQRHHLSPPHWLSQSEEYSRLIDEQFHKNM
jgi:hypothetical protein